MEGLFDYEFQLEKINQHNTLLRKLDSIIDWEMFRQLLKDGLIVFEGSTCNLEETKTAGDWVINKRKELVGKKVLIKKDDIYEFTTDYVFSSPSAAAAVVLARSANGWIEWKYQNGKTLDEVKRR